MVDVALEQKKLEMQKKKIILQEKIIKDKERIQRSRLFNEIGQLANKAGIDQADHTILLGAFIEISQKINEEKQQIEWKKNVDKLTSIHETIAPPLAIKFKDDPSPENRKVLKTLNFKWNKFRKEFYGYGNLKQIKSTLSGSDYTIHELDK